MTAIKFCGLTNSDDIAAAVALGVPAIGLVFYKKSPRYVSPDTARLLIQAIPPFVSVVALVVNIGDDELCQLAKTVSFDVLQFHGDETPKDCQRQAALVGKRWFKALRVAPNDTPGALLEHLHALKQAGASAALLDTYQMGQFGGTGQGFDWQMIPKNAPLPLILAGGLNADNVAQAAQTGVYGVDVSGGIEREKGRKCANKMKIFLQQVRS